MKLGKTAKRKVEDIVDSSLTYTKFKFQGTLYAIGDNALVKEEDDEGRGRVVKIVGIIPANGMEQYPLWPCIEVRIYYCKWEVKSSGEERSALSENELLLGDETSRIFIETVIKKVAVYTLDEYTKLDDVEEEIYFTRAYYSVSTEEIKPPMVQWERHCYCNTPFNPDLLYICCDKCGKWFHSHCFGLTSNSASELSAFFCFECR